MSVYMYASVSVRLYVQAAVPVKQLAARLLCQFTRKLKYRYQREDVVQRLINDFARGQSFWHRMLFVDTCQYLLETFSRIFFKSNFFFIVLELAKVHSTACSVIS